MLLFRTPASRFSARPCSALRVIRTPPDRLRASRIKPVQFWKSQKEPAPPPPATVDWPQILNAAGVYAAFFGCAIMVYMATITSIDKSIDKLNDNLDKSVEDYRKSTRVLTDRVDAGLKESIRLQGVSGRLEQEVDNIEIRTK